MITICYETQGQKTYETVPDNTDILKWYNQHQDYENIKMYRTSNDILEQKIEMYKQFVNVCEKFGISPRAYEQKVHLTRNGVVYTVKLYGIRTRCSKYKISWEFCGQPGHYIRTTPEFARYLLENFAVEED